MFTFDVTRHVPRFILQDKNGYAVAKAIEAALQIMNDTIQRGVHCTLNYDTMPEWRLDEMAWETNCLYDYNADIATKREWIKNAIPLYRLFGTPQAVYQYIGSYFDDVDLEENWQYDGDPYHFRVTVEGEWTAEKEVWARRAINTAKNVRSVLDSLRIGTKCHIGMTATGDVLTRFAYPLTGAENWAGRWPQENTIGIIDDGTKAGVRADAEGYRFPYPLTGTRPEINTLGIVDETKAGMRSDATAYSFGYPMTNEGVQAGTIPHENTLGVVDEARAGMRGDAKAYPFGYPMTSEGVQAGTIPQGNTLGIVGENDIQAAQAEDTYTRILYKMCGMDEI